MRKLTLALAVGLLIAATGTFVGPSRTVAAATYQTKVVIVVGQTQSVTASYISDANQAATEFQAAAAAAGSSVAITKIYSPYATWAAVKAAAKGANVLVYMGHGSGYPNPYVSYEQPNGDNGMGLNLVAGATVRLRDSFDISDPVWSLIGFFAHGRLLAPPPLRS